MIAKKREGPCSCLNLFCAIDCRVPTDFVCFRGLLTMLMCTPYEKNDDWIICATKWKGIIFLCARETAKKRRYKEQMTDRDRQFTSWGYKFEQYMSSGTIFRAESIFMYH
jgi:RAT1-interacting protein